MTSPSRITWGLVTDILGTLERHGHHQYDDQHTGQAIGVISDLVRVYEGSLDISYGTYRDQMPSLLGLGPGRPGPEEDQDVVVLTRAEIPAVRAALALAAGRKRDWAETCADCADQSCPDCRSRLQDARVYDRIGARMLRTARAARVRAASLREPAQLGTGLGRDGYAAGWEGRSVTSRRTRPGRQAASPCIPGQRAGEMDLSELDEPDDLLFPDDRWPSGRPEYVVVVAQLRGLQPSQPPSLAEVLGSGHARTREPEPDLEAEP
jgi:hypothetical protein